MRTAAVPAVPRVSWDTHARWLAAHWGIGDHISIIAKTKGGKSFLWVYGLLPIVNDRERVLVIDVKGDDPKLARNMTTVRRYPTRFRRSLDVHQRQHYRLLVTERNAEARRIVLEALRKAYAESTPQDGVTIVLDEERALTDPLSGQRIGLGLAGEVDYLATKGRTRGVTLVRETQGPRWVLGNFYDGSEFVYISRMMDTRTQRRLAEIGGDTDQIRDVVKTLQRHEFVCVSEGGDRMEIVQVEAPRGAI